MMRMRLLSYLNYSLDPFGGVNSSWKEVENFETVVAIDNVDIVLLSSVWDQVKVVVDHLVIKMFGQQTRVKKNISPG